MERREIIGVIRTLQGAWLSNAEKMKLMPLGNPELDRLLKVNEQIEVSRSILKTLVAELYPEGKDGIRASIIQQIVTERKKQDEKWGEQNHDPIEWLAILQEEIGEATKEAVDWHFGDHFDKEQIPRLIRYREEMVQAAAVSVSMLECFDRNFGELKDKKTDGSTQF